MLVTVILVGAGLFVALAGLLNWEWFLERQAQRYLFSFEKMFGRNGARIGYVIIGLIMVALGIARAAA